MMATFMILVIGMIIGWHMSSAYHARRWTIDLTRRAESMVTGVYRLPEPREPIHQDQEAIQLPPPPPSLKAICLDAHYGTSHWTKPRP